MIQRAFELYAYFRENQKIIMENYYNPLGEIKLQKFYNINTSNSELSRIILKYKYREYFLTTKMN